MSFDKILGELSQRLRRRDIRGGAPRRLEATILASLPLSPSTRGSIPVGFGFAGRLAAVCVAGAGVLALSHHVRTVTLTTPEPSGIVPFEIPASLEESKVRAAVDHTNLWHFTEVQNYPKSANFAGQSLRYETWERRAPYFYRQDFYNDDRYGETTIDDGRTGTFVVPPQRVASGKIPTLPGRIFLCPSTRVVAAPREGLERLLTGSVGAAHPPLPGEDPVSARIAVRGGGSVGERLLLPTTNTGSAKALKTIEKWTENKRINRTSISYELLLQRLSTNPVTNLPIQYISEQSAHKTPFNTPGQDGNGLIYSTRRIDIEYDGRLPATVTHLERRPGYAVIDLRNISIAIAPHGAQDPTSGIQIRAESLAHDSSGNYYVRLHNHLSFRPESLNGTGAHLSRFAADDDAGNVYVCVPIAEGGHDPNFTTLIVSPLAPDKMKALRPAKLRIRLASMFGSSWAFFSEQGIPLSLSLPVNQGVPLANLAESSVIPNSTNPPSTIRELIAMARAEHFESGNLRDPSRSAYWWDVAGNEAERLGAAGAARQYHSNAKLYRSH